MSGTISTVNTPLQTVEFTDVNTAIRLERTSKLNKFNLSLTDRDNTISCIVDPLTCSPTPDFKFENDLTKDRVSLLANDGALEIRLSDALWNKLAETFHSKTFFSKNWLKDSVLWEKTGIPLSIQQTMVVEDQDGAFIGDTLKESRLMLDNENDILYAETSKSDGSIEIVDIPNGRMVINAITSIINRTYEKETTKGVFVSSVTEWGKREVCTVEYSDYSEHCEAYSRGGAMFKVEQSETKIVIMDRHRSIEQWYLVFSKKKFLYFSQVIEMRRIRDYIDGKGKYATPLDKSSAKLALHSVYGMFGSNPHTEYHYSE